MTGLNGHAHSREGIRNKVETKEKPNEALLDGAAEAHKPGGADDRRHQGRRKEDGQTLYQFLDLHPGWMRFIVFCQSIKHGKIENLQIQDGIPACVERVKEKIKFLAVLYCVLKMAEECLIDVPLL